MRHPVYTQDHAASAIIYTMCSLSIIWAII